ncbi:unnamed protein product, partial [Laminaria digitata]
WRVLTSDQRASLRENGFVVVDGVAPVDLAAEAYEEATARASSGSLAPAHGGGGGGRPRNHSLEQSGDSRAGDTDTGGTGGTGGAGCGGGDGKAHSEDNIDQGQKREGEGGEIILTGYVRS